MDKTDKKKRIQKQTDRSKIDKKCLDRLTKIHKLIKDGTYSGKYPSFDDLINTLSTNPNKPSSVTYSIVMWVEEIYVDQTKQDSGQIFAGSVIVETGDDNNGGITGVFSAGGEE
jgi:hypothetical protein